MDLSLPEGLEHRRARGGSFLQMILYLLIAQMLAVAIFAGMLQF